MNHLRLTRFRTGLTVTALAKSSGVSRKTIHNLEAGDSPQANTAYALAKTLGVDVTDLWPNEFTSSPDQDAA